MDSLMEGMEINKEVLALSCPGVFVIIDEDLREVFVSCSNNILKGISHVVTGMKSKNHRCFHMSNVKIIVTYRGNDPKLLASKFIQKYGDMGYKVLNKVEPIKLTTRIRNLPFEDKMVAVVTLRSSRGNERIVAAFDKMEACSHWLEDSYPAGLVDRILYLEDDLTTKVRGLYE